MAEIPAQRPPLPGLAPNPAWDWQLGDPRNGFGGGKGPGWGDGAFLQCPVVWQRVSFVGDGATRDYATTAPYVTGYLRVFVNGLRQKPTTHFTEVDAELGTLNLVQAPRSNDNVEIEWAEYCNSPLGNPPKGSNGLPYPKVRPTPITATGPGKRVFVLGQSTGQQGEVAYTENIYASPVVWTKVSTGLPTGMGAGADYAKLILDPYAPGTRAWVFSITSTFSIYRNSTLRAGGSWSQVLTSALVDSATGRVNTGWAVLDMDATIAQVGLIYALVVVSVGGANYSYLFHSHDYGTSWTAVQMAEENLSPGAGSEAKRMILVGQKDALKAWASGTDQLWYTSDGGHSIAGLGASTTSVGLYLPYSANPSELILYRRNGTNDVEKSADGGATWANYSTAAWITTFQISDATSTVWADVDSTGFSYSLDSGATRTATAIAGFASVDVALLRNVMLYAAGEGTTYVHTAPPPFTTATNRTGNIATAISGLSTLEYIAPDWTS